MRETESYVYHPVILIAPFTLLSSTGMTVRPLVQIRDTSAISPREILAARRFPVSTSTTMSRRMVTDWYHWKGTIAEKSVPHFRKENHLSLFIAETFIRRTRRFNGMTDEMTMLESSLSKLAVTCSRSSDSIVFYKIAHSRFIWKILTCTR